MIGRHDNSRHELALVLPVYNEQDCIVEVIRSWRDILFSLGIDFRIIVLNDGSRDLTGERLRSFSEEPRIEIVEKTNSGHGPTILMGYNRAVTMADWVFQCDSDDEMSAVHFPNLWYSRDRYDAVFGYREGRIQGISRGMISAVSRITVRILFSSGVHDVNTPYRLMRSEILESILERIPGNTFAPNVIISGVLTRARLRILNLPVPHKGRRTGKATIVKWRLWRAAFRSFVETLRLRSTVAEVAAILRKEH